MKNGCINGKWIFNLVELDVVSGLKSYVNIFLGVDNFNLEQDIEGNIIFLLNCDGYCNIYKYYFFIGEVFQVMDLLMGVSGIMYLVLVISLDCKCNWLVYIYFFGNRYQIY